MQDNEIITIDKIANNDQDIIANEALRYALISVAFTYDRMDKNDLTKRINNIIKGKLAEGIFQWYCKNNSIKVDFKACATPFWLPDQKDFVFLNGEWDLKNNFVYVDETPKNTLDYTTLPALIPNKYSGDQWSKKDKIYLPNIRFSAYLFTYIILKKAHPDFFKCTLTQRQLEFLLEISIKYHDKSRGGMPFEESWFWNEMERLGTTPTLTFQYFPKMILTACANERYWPLFFDTAVGLPSQNPFLGRMPNWYHDNGKILKFMDGTIVTTIQNKTCPIALLPSFSSIISR